MPRFTPKTLAILAGAAAAAAGAIVLYVILSRPVHAVPEPPPALARLEPENTAKSVPAVAFTDGRGRRHMLSEFRGRYVLLNLWATWCSPCVRELPALAALQAGMPKERLVVVAVNVGRSGAAETADFLNGHGAGALGVYLDGNIALMRAFRAYGLPFSVLIDPQGREVAHAAGPNDWNAEAAIAYFKSLPML